MSLADGPTLVHLLARATSARPTNEAFVTGGRRVSYQDCWDAVRRAAGFFESRGVGSGDRVALLLRNSPEYASVYYGILAAGGVVVALNQEAKARDLAVWVRHAGARLIVADDTHPERAALAASLGADAGVVVLADVLAATPVSDPAAALPADIGNRLASIIYTSGTTGDPKGVMLSHQNLVSNVMAIVRYLSLTPSDRVLAALPFFYSYGNSVLHTHLAAGATLVLEAGMMYPQRVVETMRQQRVTGFSGVPWMFVLLLDRTDFAASSGLESLRYMTQAGAAMKAADIDRTVAAFPNTAFYVMYGQTEATARLTYLPPSDLAGRRGSAGQPIPGVALEVRRPDGSMASPGETGEVHAAGPGIMMGYWQAPEASAAAIATDVSGRWLRTGDVGYRDADGFLFLVGRSSEIIKTGAHRVSPSEIEEVVLRLDGVSEAAACGVPDDQLGEAIQVVVVPKTGHRLSERDVLAHCRRELSLYKIPKRVLFAASLPRTTSGKVRRRALADVTNLEAVPWAN